MRSNVRCLTHLLIYAINNYFFLALSLNSFTSQVAKLNIALNATKSKVQLFYLLHSIVLIRILDTKSSTDASHKHAATSGMFLAVFL
jgi:hypothetical protein